MDFDDLQSRLSEFDLGTGQTRIYNIVSIVFLGLTVVAMCGFFFAFLSPPRESSVDVAALPTELIVPTATATFTPTITRTPFPATFTPTFTFTPSPTGTTSPTPTVPPTQTIAPSATITATVLVTEEPIVEGPTPTATFGVPPTSPPPFLFGVAGPPDFVPNTFNAAGCTWQGVGGQVLSLTGGAFPNELVVNVTGGGLIEAQTARTGSNSLYGTGGFEIQIANGVNSNTYFVQIESTFGTPLSDEVQVTFPADCEGNVALLTFQQLREP